MESQLLKRFTNKVLQYVPKLSSWKERPSVVGAPIWSFYIDEIMAGDLSLKEVCLHNEDFGFKTPAQFKRAINQKLIRVNGNIATDENQILNLLDLRMCDDWTVIRISISKKNVMVLRLIIGQKRPILERIQFQIEKIIERYIL